MDCDSARAKRTTTYAEGSGGDTDQDRCRDPSRYPVSVRKGGDTRHASVNTRSKQTL